MFKNLFRRTAVIWPRLDGTLKPDQYSSLSAEQAERASSIARKSGATAADAYALGCLRDAEASDSALARRLFPRLERLRRRYA
jgi:hypothetical protein